MAIGVAIGFQAWRVWNHEHHISRSYSRVIFLDQCQKDIFVNDKVQYCQHYLALMSIEQGKQVQIDPLIKKFKAQRKKVEKSHQRILHEASDHQKVRKKLDGLDGQDIWR